jgi:hypothetical protein
MSSLIPATALVILGIGALFAGWRGMAVSRAVTKEKGPNTLIHYPAPIPWLRTKVSSARWVSWIGRLYAITGLVFIVAGGSHFSQSANDPKLKPCMELLDVLEMKTIIHTPITRRVVQEGHSGCRVEIIDQENVVWVTVSSAPPGTLIGEGFGHQTQELNRRGFDVTPLTISERRSIVGRPPKGGNDSPVVIVEEAEGFNTIEFNPIVANEALIQSTISTLHSKQTGKTTPGM